MPSTRPASNRFKLPASSKNLCALGASNTLASANTLIAEGLLYPGKFLAISSIASDFSPGFLESATFLIAGPIPSCHRLNTNGSLNVVSTALSIGTPLLIALVSELVIRSPLVMPLLSPPVIQVSGSTAI